MRLNRLLRYLLETESWEQASSRRKTEGVPPEAPEDAPLGQYLFAPARSDVPTPKEKNTDLEKVLSRDLGRHFEGEGDIASVEKSLVTLMGFEKQGMYKKLLSPPAGRAYRFIKNIKPERASELFLNGYSAENIVSNPNVAFYVPNIGIIDRPSASSTVARGETNISSWTISPTKPNFADFCSTRPDLVAILLVADIQSNEFFLNPDNISNFAQADRTALDASLVKREREVIAYGPVNVIEASAIYIKPTVSGEEIDNLRYRCPKIEVPPVLDPEMVIPSSVFKPAYDYVNACVEKYLPSDVDSYVLKYITTDNKFYILLKMCAENGFDITNPQTRSYVMDNILIGYGYNTDEVTARLMRDVRQRLTEITDSVFNRLIQEIKSAEPISNYNAGQNNGIPIQKELLRALSLKIEKAEL